MRYDSDKFTNGLKLPPIYFKEDELGFHFTIDMFHNGYIIEEHRKNDLYIPYKDFDIKRYITSFHGY
jgi:hypothetical protein